MVQNLEKTRAMVRNSVSRASTISAEECQLTLTEDDFIVIQRKMDKIDQRLDELYKNWHAGYRDAVSSKECEEIKRFYKPYLEKYESKYRILYHLLQPSSFSAQEPTSRINPSLAALDNAPALRQREWIRGELGEDMSQQYSNISGHLTPTPPRHEDMRLDSSLNIMLEGFLDDLPNVVHTEEARERKYQVPEERPQGTPFETSKEGIRETHLKVKPESNMRGTPRRIQRTREASREEAIESTRQFFAAVDKRNRNNTTGRPIGISSEVCGRNDIDVPGMSTTFVTTTPVVPDAETTETGNPRIILLNGSPPQHTATATCRPRTWMQQIVEGQINEPTRESDGSYESNPSEPYVLAKGIPDELGHEWRVLHPFELPGVRFPMDSTPPNQRRLAENDALVELIQTTKYLEDTPTWGQRDYQLYPSQYGDLFYRGRSRGR